MAFIGDFPAGPVDVPTYSPIVHAAEGIFRAVTAAQNPRYEKDYMLATSHRQIPSSARSRFSSSKGGIPEGWISCIHPEGAVYYIHHKMKICTDTPIYDTALYADLRVAIDEFQQLAERLNVSLPEDHELYLQIDTINKGFCYYLIDHDRQMQFWLQDVYSYDLNLPKTASMAHLDHILQEHYWTHVEYFPHRPVNLELRSELLGILYHARIDQMTSETCTFPFDADQCSKFAKIIDAGAPEDRYMTCVIARIWSSVARHRFDHFYGEEYARLGRDQKRIECKQLHKSTLMTFCYMVSFGFPESVEAELNSLLTDNLVYVIHWRKFAHSIIKEWKNATYISLGLLIANGSLLGVCQTSISTLPGLASAMISVTGAYASLSLQAKYGNFESMSCTSVAYHLASVEHDNLGYAPAATLYASPKALTSWAVIFLFIEVVNIVVERVGWLICVIPAMFLLLYGAFALMHALSAKIGTFMHDSRLRKDVEQGLESVLRR